jgi:Tol biopolymer transport system component
VLLPALPYTFKSGTIRCLDTIAPGRDPSVTRRSLIRRLGLALAPVAAGLWAGCAVPSLSVSLQTDATPSPAGVVPTPTPRAGPPGMTLTPFANSLPGRMLFVADANVWQLQHGQLRAITTDRVSRQPSWSRDGQRIALVKLWTSGSDLWIADADGRNGLEMTDFTYREDARQNYALSPIWSQDGTRLYFLSQEASQDTQLWQVTLADKRRQRLVSHGERSGGIDHPRLSPDGKQLVVTSFQPGRGPAGRPQVWIYSLPNGPWRQLTEHSGGAYDPEWSPDGTRLAYVVRTGEASASTARHDVWTMRVDGSGARSVTTSGQNRAPAWSPDGAWLVFLSSRSGTFEAWAVPSPADIVPSGAVTLGPGPTSTAAAVASARQITQAGSLEAASGLAWAL